MDELVCADLDRAIALFTGLGLRLEMIYPADDPAVAEMRGAGASVRLVRSGAQVELGAARAAPAFSLVRAGDTPWRTGRAGMEYRDLIPDRQGGRIIGSHIRIVDGGPVPDYVHHHAIELQLIYCYRGWVRVVYEDQGPPFVMTPGTCVLQPPGIRHRVLESSPGLEVIELGVPAVHATHVDHERALPTSEVVERSYGGQRFVRAAPDAAPLTPWLDGWDARELGIRDATRGFAAVHVVRPRASIDGRYQHDGELWFGFVLSGGVVLDGTPLGAADAFVVPPGQPCTLAGASPELAILSLSLPADRGLQRI